MTTRKCHTHATTRFLYTLFITLFSLIIPVTDGRIAQAFEVKSPIEVPVRYRWKRDFKHLIEETYPTSSPAKPACDSFQKQPNNDVVFEPKTYVIHVPPRLPYITSQVAKAFKGQMLAKPVW